MLYLEELEGVHDTCQKFLEGGGSVYVLVEGAGKNPIARNYVFDHSSTLEYFPIYANTDFEPLMSISPLLVSVTATHDFLNWFLSEGTQHKAGIILLSLYHMKQVTSHLQGMLEVELPNMNLAAFRYYDPTVLHKYAYGVEAEARMRLLGPLSGMFWGRPISDKGIAWHGLYSDAEMEDNNPYLQPQPPIKITEAQLERFEEAQLEEIAEKITTHFSSQE